MAGCRIVNAGVTTAVSAVLESSEAYKREGDELISALDSAISEMEGDAKDALYNFIHKDIQQFIADALPKALSGMSELLEANRQNFENVDRQLADSINQ